jgi:hypothetical protein
VTVAARSPAFALPTDAHTLVQQGHAYWRALRPVANLLPEALPGRQHIDPVQIPALLPHLWLLDVVHDPAAQSGLRLRYRLIGSHVELGFGQIRTGRWFDDVEPAFATDPLLRAPYEAAVLRHEPSYRRGKPRFVHNNTAAALERLMLPLAGNGRDVDMLLGFTVFYDSEGGIIRPAL